MTNSNSEIRELNANEPSNVAGGMPFFGMGCSLNQNEAIGAVVGALGSIPIIGGVLADAATAIGRGICGG